MDVHFRGRSLQSGSHEKLGSSYGLSLPGLPVIALGAARGTKKSLTSTATKAHRPSGSNFPQPASRPEFNRLMKDARKRRFDAVVTWKLDRWGRSLIQSLQSIQELVSIGVRFIAITQNIDTDESNPMSRFMLQIFAAFSEFERETIRERVCAGIRNAKHKGKQLGRRRVVFDRGRAPELQQAGASVREIAKTLKIGRGTVQRFLAQKGVGSSAA